jgi:hypothetical protein
MHLLIVLQGRQIFLNLGYALKYDERWLSEQGQKTGAFMPFGGGLRLCVGYILAQAEMKVWPHQASPASAQAVSSQRHCCLPVPLCTVPATKLCPHARNARYWACGV